MRSPLSGEPFSLSSRGRGGLQEEGEALPRPLPQQESRSGPQFCFCTAGYQKQGGTRRRDKAPIAWELAREREEAKLGARGKQGTPHNSTCKGRSLVLKLPGRGVAGVSKPSRCHSKPQSSPVPRLGWAGALHNVPQLSLPSLARVTTWSQKAALPVLAGGPKATLPWGKDLGQILKTQGGGLPHVPSEPLRQPGPSPPK